MFKTHMHTTLCH